MEVKEILKKHELAIQSIRLSVDQQDKVLSSIDISLKEIRIALLGNEMSGDKGLAHKIESLENRATRLERFKDAFWIYATIGGSIILTLQPVIGAWLKVKLGL